MIKLNITRTRELTEEELEGLRKSRGYYSDSSIDRESRISNINILEVEISEEQFEAIRKAVLEKF